MTNAADAYRQLAPAVLGYLRAEGADDAENVLGEVFLDVVRGLHRFSGDDVALRAWVFTIARHRLIDERRRQARRPRSDAGASAEHSAPAAPAAIDGNLVAALGQLTAEQREVVVLRFVGDLSLDAVATITGRRVVAVKAMQHRALAQLARILGPGRSAITGDD